MNFNRLVLISILMGWLWAFGAVSSGAANSCDSEKPFGREDKTLLARHCGLCHTVSGNWRTIGPSLKGLFEKKQLVTGKPVTVENLRDLIMNGGPTMPGFQATLSTDQANEIIRDLKETRCSSAPAAQEDQKADVLKLAGPNTQKLTIRTGSSFHASGSSSQRSSGALLLPRLTDRGSQPDPRPSPPVLCSGS